MNDKVDELIEVYAGTIFKKVRSNDAFLEDMIEPVYALAELITARQGERFKDT